MAPEWLGQSGYERHRHKAVGGRRFQSGGGVPQERLAHGFDGLGRHKPKSAPYNTLLDMNSLISG